TPRLGERLFGELVGQTALKLDWRARPAGGETLEAFVARTKSTAADALAGSDVPCIVAHGGNLRVITAALGVAFLDEYAPNALPLRFDRTDAGWAVTVL
ncbi:MAG: histidine phosphatase family protein, partial [Alphaproteobacteria bacterium]|nr:histidine phosphatase family protein [Alphaproteobacteria bacterium]